MIREAELQEQLTELQERYLLLAHEVRDGHPVAARR
jgi:hypothetical protein